MKVLRILIVASCWTFTGCETPAPEGQRIGNTMPDFQGEDVDGKLIKLSDYKGKVVLLNFWGTWCGPCQQLMPHEIKKVTVEYKNRPFAMIGVAMDNAAALKEFLAVRPLPWANIVDRTGVIAKVWNVDVVPSFLLIDHHGTIRGRWFSGVTRDAEEVWKEVESLVQQAEVK